VAHVANMHGFSAAGRPQLRFELLGAVRVLRDGQEIDLGPAKQRAVLAVLLLNAGRAVPTDRIVDAVWGDGPPENGPNVVQKYVAGLRRALDPDRSPRTPGELISLTGGGYLVHVASDALDVAQFRAGLTRAAAERDEGCLAEAAETLRRALGRWRGPALAGLSGAVFETARDGLDEEHATAWETWAEVELAQGDHAALVPDLVRLVAEFPLREGLRAQLMLALHRAGRQAEALAVFRDARRYLMDEFGVEPGARLQETHRMILRGEEPAAPIVPSPRTEAFPTPEPYVPQPYIPQPYIPESPDPSPYALAATGTAAAPRVIGRRYSVGEMIFAGLTPIVLCSIGSGVYFAVAAIRRRDLRQVFVAAGYASAFVVFLAVVGESELDSTASALGAVGLLLLPVFASIHGMVLAAHPGDSPKQKALRADARLIAQTDPARAREMGVGRPDLPRDFDDGGLVDVNHAPGSELDRLPGLDSDTAHRIVMDRHQHGPFHRVEDLVVRGLIRPGQLHRLESRLVCVPVAVSRPVEPPPR